MGVQSLGTKLSLALRISPDAHGALVSQVMAEGPAGKAGILLEDVITSVNGKPVGSERDLLAQSAGLPIGQIAQVTLLRDGREETLPVKVVEHPDDQKSHRASQTARAPRQPLGIDLAPLSPDVAAELKTKNLNGVVIAEVARDSAAQRAGLEPGDIIRAINHHAVGNVEELVEVIKREEGSTGLAFLVERDGETRFLVIDTWA